MKTIRMTEAEAQDAAFMEQLLKQGLSIEVVEDARDRQQGGNEEE